MAKANRQKVANQEVTFVSGAPEIPESGVVLHKGSKISKKVEDVKEDYDAIITQVSFILSDSESPVEKSGFKLDEITVSLAFNAKGKIGFIIAGGEAGVEAGIQLKFKRK